MVPRDNTSAPFTAEQLYAALHAGTARGQATQIVLAGDSRDVGIWLRVETPRLEPVAAMVRATYPDAELEPTPRRCPPTAAHRSAALGAAPGARWGLLHEAAYPIKTVRAFEHSDPMAMMLGALAECLPGEHGALSLLLTPAPGRFARRSLTLTRALVTGADLSPWWQRALLLPVEILASLLEAAVATPGSAPGSGAGQVVPLNADLEARVKWIAGKAAQPAFTVTLHTAWLGQTPPGPERGHAGLVSALGQFAVVGQNALTVRRPDAAASWQAILHAEQPRRERMVLAIDELAGLMHSPGPDLIVPRLRRTRARRREATRSAARPAGCTWPTAPTATATTRSGSASGS